MEIDVTKSKKIVFNISLANVDIGTIKGTFRLYYDNSLSIGVSTFVEKGKLVVNVPILSFMDFEEKEYKAELEIVAGDYFTVPWSDKIKIQKPVSVKVETEMKESKKDFYVMVTKPLIIG